ncbi:MAG: FkbM family methyltransferase [Bacteroidota bacterium]|nr:FkbM family methyltransferase [Bacteroidota bacterium]
MNVLSNIKFILNHPLNRNHKAKAFFRFVKWQVNTKLNPHPIIYPFTQKAKLIVQKGMTGATGNLYCGLHDYEDMGFLLHFLRKEDCFVDIGANIGSYTILASAHVGAKTISIEPAPVTFSHLMRNISLNQIQDKVVAHNIAVGSAKGNINFTTSLDTLNHAVQNEEPGTAKVAIETLDEILKDGLIPSLLKIDVEGFETEVIKGASNILQQNGLKAIIIELNGSGKSYGYEENKIHESLINLNFQAFTYDPQTRKLSSVDSFGKYNTIYIRDFVFVQQRLETAQKFKILNQEF